MLWILKPDASVPVAVASAAAMTATNCPCERAVSGSAESCLMLWMRRPRASVPMYVASAAATTASKQARSPIGNPVCLETAGAGAFAACCFEAGSLAVAFVPISVLMSFVSKIIANNPTNTVPIPKSNTNHGLISISKPPF